MKLLARSVFSAALLALGSLAGCTAPATRVCDPGRVVRCPCAEEPAREGTQSCRDDGTGYGPCTGCGTADAGTTDARSEDARPDAAIDAPVGDAPVADARTVDAPAGDAPLVTGACVYPTLEGMATPTSGRCEGNAAVTCDRNTGVLAPTACGADERCVEFDVEQVDLSGPRATIPGHRYRWAACVPRDARPCPFAWDAMYRSWTATDGFFRCDGATHEIRCEMPLPPLPMFPYNAGTTVGFERRVTCTGSDQCRGDRCLAGASPCTTSRSWCEGNDWLTCSAGEYAMRIPCGDLVCRSSTVCQGAETASCFPRAFLEPSGRCDPMHFEGGCGPTGGLLVCGSSGISCFDEGGQCRCSVSEEACFGGNTCRAVGSGSSARFECLPTGVSCDGGSRCDGQTVVRCDAEGRPALFDCAAQGMQCVSAGGRVGCALGADTCDAVLTPSRCTGPMALNGCCPSDGAFVAGPRTVPCIAGRRVQFTCPSVPGAPPYMCSAGQCGVM